MKIGLICTDNLRCILLELLSARNISVEDDSNVYMVESGCKAPEGKISILFELNNIGGLMELLERLSKNTDESSSTIIGRLAEDRYEIIPYKQIHFFEGQGNNVYCVTASNEYRIKEKLYELEEKLPQKRFIRVSKSFIVNIGNVKEIIPWFGRRLVLRFPNSKREIEVSKNYVKNFKEFLGL